MRTLRDAEAILARAERRGRQIIDGIRYHYRHSRRSVMYGRVR
jgi:hypothetical protein